MDQQVLLQTFQKHYEDFEKSYKDSLDREYLRGFLVGWLSLAIHFLDDANYRKCHNMLFKVENDISG